jgi:hypothetical protein
MKRGDERGAFSIWFGSLCEKKMALTYISAVLPLASALGSSLADTVFLQVFTILLLTDWALEKYD